MTENSIILSKDERLIIIPDIHNKCDKAEEIIRIENPDKVLFLGDYFDSIGDDISDADNTSKWLAKSIKQNNRTHLIGNHDLNYMTYNPKLKCMGYDSLKHKVIEENNIEWYRLKLFCWIDDWLCTHAGFTNQFYTQKKKETSSVDEIMQMSEFDLANIHDENYTHDYFQIGTTRGGTCLAGGIVWCDYDEFVDIPGIKQIFGHTRDDTIRHKKTSKSEHYCIDTRLNHYAIYRNHEMKIMPAIS